MKIAIVTETFLPSTDGIVTRLCASIRWLLQNGHEVMIIAPEGVDEFEGAEIAAIPARTFFLYKARKWAYPSRLVKKYLNEFKPDVVHVVNPSLLGVAGVYYTKKNKLPLLCSYHTHLPKYADYYNVSFIKPVLWGYLRLLHNRAHQNLCTSQSVLTELTEQKFNNVKVWERGVDAEKFHPGNKNEKMRERLTAGKTEKTLLLFVGRLASEKNIERIKDVLQRAPEVCLALVGDGPFRKELEKHFEGTNTVFTGFLHGDELAQAYASSDIFVFPSTTETLGLVLLEAMASQLPVVAADSTPTREQVTDGESGMLFKPDEPEHFVEQVLELLNQEKREKMAKHAILASKDMGWDKTAQQLLSFYQQTVKLAGNDSEDVLNGEEKVY